ncbi:MAG TPA: ABC transporter permease, partial [Rhodothermales bacterium]|nr:ABC transporter permease [Rhodothermales bacterium]
MIKNHFKLAWRNLRKYPGYSFLNLGGLALGIAAAFVLALYVRQELTYDQHFEDSDRIYRIATDFFNMGGFANSQQQLLDVLPQETPIIEEAARLQRGGSALPIFVDEQRYEEPNYLYGDSAFFQMFSYRFLAGDPETALHASDEIILSDRLAQKYFGDESAIGRVLLVGKEQEAHRVSAVVEMPPGKTHFAADFWLPLVPQDPYTNWTNVSYYNYVKLRPDATQADLERAVEAVRERHAYPSSGFSGSFEEWAELPTAVEFFVQPLTGIYLHSSFNFELGPGGSPAQVYILGLIGVFILLIAGMNYVNLTTARSSIRAKEVGVKKTLGAGQPALVQQFLAETVVFSVLAMVIAAGMAEGMLAAFSYITGAVLVDSVFANGWHLLTLVGFSVAVGLLAGIYPAFYLSSFRPVKILKGEWAIS